MSQKENHTVVIDSEKVAEIAKLARLQIDESQLDAVANDLNKILLFARIIMETNLKPVKPKKKKSYDSMSLRRPDEVNDGGYPDRILANAPEAREGFFVVPKMFE